MTILRYTCTDCGIVTRVEQGQSYCACACRGGFEMVNESDESQTVVIIEPVNPE